MYSRASSEAIKKNILYYIKRKTVNSKITSNLHNIEPNGRAKLKFTPNTAIVI